MMKEIWGKIKCPYCFGVFSHNKVHFRIAGETCEYARNRVNKTEDLDEQTRIAKFMRQAAIDVKYNKVWGSLRGGTPAARVEELFHVPWVDEINKAYMIDGDYIPDRDGFIEKIEDKFGHFESKIRICPYCHNKLPLHYGKNPQIFVSILGVSASGKTVFLKQLLSKLQDSLEGGVLGHVNGSFVELTLPEDDTVYLKIDQPLPDSTKTLNFKMPYFVTMTFNKDNALKTYDFVIYDIAGEILVDLLKNDPNKFDFFAGYIKSSDAIITLIDPMQLVNHPKPQYPASEMISTLYSVFGGQVQIPTAVTISKSDLLLSSDVIRENLNPDGIFFGSNSIIAKNIPWDPAKKFFYADEYAKLSGQLNRFFTRKANPFYQSVKQQIPNAAFFAVSALFDGVDQQLTFELASKDEWKSKSIDDYMNKFEILSKKLKDIQFDLEEQEKNPNDNIIDSNNIIVSRSFVFDQSDEIVSRLDKILSNVSLLNTKAEVREAVFDQFDEDEVIELIAADHRGDEMLSVRELIKYISYLNDVMTDCSFDIYMQGYPRRFGDLKSLRIEEPFFWLLNEMGIIARGNLYAPTQAQKPTQTPKLTPSWWPFGGKKQ